MRPLQAILRRAKQDPAFAQALMAELRKTARPLKLEDYKLEGLADGRPVMLYHGTTKLFRSFDMSFSRDELVNQYYGKGIFLALTKRVAEQYANANRNIGFPPEIVDDLKRKNPNAGKFLQALVEHGRDGWETYWQENGFWRSDPPQGEGAVDFDEFEKHLGGIDGNDLGDLAGYIIGSKTSPLRDNGGSVNIFNMSTGAPDWLYDLLDKIGLDSSVYRPKVYTVMVTVKNPLITANKAKARKAQQQGYDCVVYHGTNLVGGVPEVAVFSPKSVRIVNIELV